MRIQKKKYSTLRTESVFSKEKIRLLTENSARSEKMKQQVIFLAKKLSRMEHVDLFMRNVLILGQNESGMVQQQIYNYYNTLNTHVSAIRDNLENLGDEVIRRLQKNIRRYSRPITEGLFSPIRKRINDKYNKTTDKRAMEMLNSFDNFSEYDNFDDAFKNFAYSYGDEETIALYTKANEVLNIIKEQIANLKRLILQSFEQLETNVFNFEEEDTSECFDEWEWDTTPEQEYAPQSDKNPNSDYFDRPRLGRSSETYDNTLYLGNGESPQSQEQQWHPFGDMDDEDELVYSNDNLYMIYRPSMKMYTFADEDGKFIYKGTKWMWFMRGGDFGNTTTEDLMWDFGGSCYVIYRPTIKKYALARSNGTFITNRRGETMWFADIKPIRDAYILA